MVGLTTQWGQEQGGNSGDGLLFCRGRVNGGGRQQGFFEVGEPIPVGVAKQQSEKKLQSRYQVSRIPVPLGTYDSSRRIFFF